MKAVCKVKLKLPLLINFDLHIWMRVIYLSLGTKIKPKQLANAFSLSLRLEIAKIERFVKMKMRQSRNSLN